MTSLKLDHEAGRIGRLDCVCPPGERTGADVGLNRLIVCFGLNILSQTLVLSALPIAASATLPLGAAKWMLGVPYAMCLAGAALATFPAAILLDGYGRRAAFALGASLGLAGGLLAAWSALHRNFFILCLAALWIGLANGFALFYRHAAAASPASPRNGALVFSGGALAALLAPSILHAISDGAGPFLDAYALAGAGILNLGALMIAVTFPHALMASTIEAPARPYDGTFVLVVTSGAASWFVMTGSMAVASPTLLDCGVSAAGVGGVIGWHLVAMYAPAAFLRFAPESTPLWLPLGLGAILQIIGAVAFFGAAGGAEASAGIICAGFGWSVLNSALLFVLYSGGRPPRAMLALNDAALLFAALAGALTAPLMLS